MMKRWSKYHLLGAALGATLLVGCGCPSSYRLVPVPQVKNEQDVRELSRCQVRYYGTTLLGQANSAVVANALLKRGASMRGRLIIHGKELNGNPLNLATEPAIIRVLTAAGCSPDVQGGLDNSTPLCAAVRRGQYETIAFLLAAGANPNLADSSGEPPLCIAARLHDSRLCELLLSCGARPNGTTRDKGVTPLLALLHSGDAIEANTEAKQNIAQMLLAAGANPLQADADGTLPLHYAPACLLSLFIANGGNVNCRDAKGRTPLFFGGSQQRLEILLQGGADLQARDYSGNTAFDTVPEAGLKSFLLIRGCRSGKAL